MRDFEQETPDWQAEAHPWCKFCCVPKCGCPEGDRLTDEAYRAIEEAHIVRGAE